jgi:4,5-dihydroxyphthalate decarboxylase
MHLVAIRRDIYEKHPFVAASLCRALVAAKQHAMHKMRIQVSLRYMLPWLADHVAEIDQVFGGDAFPYGVEPNRPTLNALVQYLHEQALIAAPVRVDDLFVPIDGGG